MLGGRVKSGTYVRLAGRAVSIILAPRILFVGALAVTTYYHAVTT